MKKWEQLAQQAMLEPDPKKALEIYNEARREAIKAKAMKGDDDKRVMVCDSLNMRIRFNSSSALCKKREDYIKAGFGFTDTPNFCLWCGKKWYETAILEEGNNEEEKI